MICASVYLLVFIRSLLVHLADKILLPQPLDFGGDYPMIVAEDITSRSLNVISLFNGVLPIITIQLQAYEVSGHTTLVFTKVLDQVERGLVDEDEDAISAPTDRAYWETQRATPKTLALMEKVFELVQEADPEVELKYNKFHVGLIKQGRAQNYVTFRANRTSMTLEPKLPRTDETDALLEAAGLETLEYATRWNHYRIRVTEKDIKTHTDLFKQLISEERDRCEG